MDHLKKRVDRVLDANINRAAEGLRVVEDVSRFVYGDAQLYRGFRKVRHQLHMVSTRYFPSVISARHVDGDVGRKILEDGRSVLKDVVVANVKRAQEALRVLEEVGKLVSMQAGSEFKTLRYQLYRLEKSLWKRS